MSTALYNAEILRLAATIPHAERLTAPHGSSERRSPVCGSRVAVDVMLDGDGRIAAIGQQVRACALGQASANLMAAHAVGRSMADIAAATGDLSAWLAGGRDDPGAWPGLAIFAPAIPHRARHASILLAFEAAAEAVARAEEHLRAGVAA